MLQKVNRRIGTILDAVANRFFLPPCHSFVSFFTWLRAKCFLYWLFHNQFLPTNHVVLRNFLRNQFGSVADYSFTFHMKPGTVYFRVSKHFPQFYVGMTQSTITDREQTRRRKFLQFSTDPLVHVEPAIRFWFATRSFHRFTPIAVSHSNCFLTLLHQEASLIAFLKPGLNAPFVNFKFLKGACTGSVFAPKFTGTVQSHRLWKKVRRRFFGHHVSLFTAQSDTSRSLRLLVHLGARSFQSFRTNCLLRRPAVSSATILGLLRHCHFLSSPSGNVPLIFSRKRFYAEGLSLHV